MFEFQAAARPAGYAAAHDFCHAAPGFSAISAMSAMSELQDLVREFGGRDPTVVAVDNTIDVVTWMRDSDQTDTAMRHHLRHLLQMLSNVREELEP